MATRRRDPNSQRLSLNIGVPLSASSPTCPNCNSNKSWRDGIRYTQNGEIQRWLCRSCGYRFSESASTKLNDRDTSEHHQRIHTNLLKSQLAYPLNRQICAAQPKGAKNLATVETPTQEKAQGESTENFAARLLEIGWWFKKQGYSEVTIRGTISALRTLWQRGANMYDPESVKSIIAKQVWSDNRRRNVINAYALFVKFHGLTWEKPRCHIIDQKFPFIPTEQEIDALIAGCGTKTSTFLQVLKETAMRSGEAKRLLWTNIDLSE
jgi:ribosomal protein L37AE/L43A